MFKNIQIRIVLIFFVIGIGIISGLSFFFMNSINQLSTMMQEANDVYHIETLNAITRNSKIIIGVAIISFTTITILIGIFLSKVVIYPINKLIASAEKIAAREDKRFKEKEPKEKNEVNGLVNAFDIVTTELEDKLSEVQKQNKQIETILLHMTDGIVAFDIDGQIMLINPAAKKLLSVSPENNTFNDIFEKFKLDINMEKIIYLENWTSTEQRIEVKDKYVNVFFAPFRNDNFNPDGVIAVIQDITEHVKLDNMRREFVSDVSHELKTPITSIMGYADTLLEGEYDKETQDKFLNIIATEARRMAKLVTDLLSLSRYDNNKNKLEKEFFDLGELTKKCQEKLGIEIKKKNQQVNCFVTAEVPPVYADRYDIERVVLNILSNAIKYTKENGKIDMYIGFVYNDAYIKVIDNGLGISEEDLSRIFERFYRVDKARTRENGGTGLGLSIAKEILDKNGGSIDMKSKVGKGTEVVIRIPTKK